MVFCSINVKEIKNAIGEADWVLSTGLKSGGTQYPQRVATGVKGVYHFLWKLKVGSGSRHVIHRKLKISISQSVVVVFSKQDHLLKGTNQTYILFIR